MIDAGNSYKDRVSRLISWGHWFMVANIVLAMAMSVRYIFAKDIDGTLVSALYLVLTLVGHLGLLGIVSYIIVLFPLTFVFPSSKAMRAIGAFVATSAIIALLIDGSIYQNYQLHLNLLVFDLSGFSLDNSIGWGTISLFLLALLTVEVTLANLIWKRLAMIRQWNIGNRVAGIFFTAFIASHLIHIWADATLYQPVLSYDRVFPLSHGSTARGLLTKYGISVDDIKRKEINIGNNPKNITYPLKPLQCSEQSANNLLFITLATANHDFVTPSIMPGLSQFADDSIVAKQHISTSLDPKLAKFNIQTGLPAQYENVFTSKKHQYPLQQKASSGGLVRQVYSNETGDFSQQSAAALDQNNATKLINFLSASTGSGYYADITLYSSQELDSPAGFMPLVELNNVSSLSAPERVLAQQYLRSLSYIDQLISKIIANVDLSNTTVVVTANRGMDLTALYNSSNQYSKVNLHVPLIISLPGTANVTINKLTSHYDVLPTLLQHHFGCVNPSQNYSVGNDLLSTLANDLIYIGANNEFAIYQNKQIAEINRHGDFKFYDSQYRPIDNGHLPFQQIINLMAKQRRFTN
jgi:uncharacterized protein